VVFLAPKRHRMKHLEFLKYFGRDQGSEVQILSPTNIFRVQPGDMGNRTFRRHGLHFWPEGICKGLQSFLLQVYITQIIVHKADEPDAVVDLFDADGLASQAGTEIDLFAIKTQATAVGDHDRLVVKRVMGIGNAAIGSDRFGIDLGRILHVQCFVRSFDIEFLDKGIELGLLLQDISAGWPRGLLLQGQMHTFMAAILLGMPRANPFDADPQAQPPHG